MPYRLDLATLLVRDLNEASAAWNGCSGFSRCDAGHIPAELALRLGQPALAEASWAALAREGIDFRLRLVQFAPSDAVNSGWGRIRIIDEPEPTAARVAVDLHAADGGLSSAFYMGLLGARQRHCELRLAGASLRLCSIAAVPLHAPFSLRFQRYTHADEAIGRLTELPRCLSGPQGEIIELI